MFRSYILLVAILHWQSQNEHERAAAPSTENLPVLSGTLRPLLFLSGTEVLGAGFRTSILYENINPRRLLPSDAIVTRPYYVGVNPNTRSRVDDPTQAPPALNLSDSDSDSEFDQSSITSSDTMSTSTHAGAWHPRV